MLYSGVRPSEVLGITENIKNNTLIIKNSKLKNYQKEKYRMIPISPKKSILHKKKTQHIVLNQKLN